MGKSSKDRRDIYYRLAKEEGWRARSAYKLLHMDMELNLLENINRAVDLCAAPGSWSQVLSQAMKPLENEGKYIVAVDLQEMAPIPGVECFKGDITSNETAKKVIEKLGNSKADIVVCDGAPDVTGYHDFDEHLQSNLFMAALNISAKILRPEGTFVAKIFRSSKETVQYLFSNTQLFFKDVMIAKPRSSRSSSVEAFVVAREFGLPANYYDPDFENTRPKLAMYSTLRMYMKKVTCGGETFDSDTNYPLSALKDHVYPFKIMPPNPKVLTEGYSMDWKPAVQPPIKPPYEKALALRKAKKLPHVENNVIIYPYYYQRKVKVIFQGGLENLVFCGSELSFIYPLSRKHYDQIRGFLKFISKCLTPRGSESFVTPKGVLKPGVVLLINDIKWDGHFTQTVKDDDIVTITTEDVVGFESALSEDAAKSLEVPNDANTDLERITAKFNALSVTQVPQLDKKYYMRTIKLKFREGASCFVICQGKGHRWCFIDLPKSRFYHFKFKGLLEYMVDHILDFISFARPELFIRHEQVCPGFVVDVNGTNYEELGKYDYELQDGDVVSFTRLEVVSIYDRNIPRLSPAWPEYKMEKKIRKAIADGCVFEGPPDPLTVQRNISFQFHNGTHSLIKPEWSPTDLYDLYFSFLPEPSKFYLGKQLKIEYKKSEEHGFKLEGVLNFLKEKILTKPEALFRQDIPTVRFEKGVRLQVNDRSDFLKMGYLDYEIQENDTIQLEAPLYIEEVHGPERVATNYTVKFYGGLQNMFGYRAAKERHCLHLYKPGKTPDNFTLRTLLERYEKSSIDRRDSERFIKDGKLRSDILVTINNVDWAELETQFQLDDKLDYPIKHEDEISFIGALYGG